MDREHSISVWFLCGLALGTVSTLLFAPETGEATRRSLAEQGGRTLNRSSREFLERGRELYEKGREIAEDAAEFFERSRKLPQDAAGLEKSNETV